MASFTSGEGYETHHLLDNYDWASIDARGGTVVDLGGSHGFVCVALAQRWKNMRFVVQDLPKTIASAPKLEPDEIAARIVFQAHDFNTEQPVKGADGMCVLSLPLSQAESTPSSPQPNKKNKT